MKKHWYFLFKITDQDLISSPGAFLHGNSLFLAGPEPHSFSHSSAFPSVPGHMTCPNVCCDPSLLCRPLQQVVHHSNYFTRLNCCSSPEKLSDFFLFLCVKWPVRLLRPLCVCSFRPKHLHTSLSADKIPDAHVYVHALYCHRLIQEGKEASSPLPLVNLIFPSLPKYCNFLLLCFSFTPVFLLNKADLWR